MGFAADCPISEFPAIKEVVYPVFLQGEPKVKLFFADLTTLTKHLS